MKISDEIFKKHMIDQHTRPDADSELWVAYIILLEKYPNIGYWSYDGYHAHALCDYSLNTPYVWKGNSIINWNTKEVDYLTFDLESLTSREIIKIWNDVVNENL